MSDDEPDGWGQGELLHAHTFHTLVGTVWRLCGCGEVEQRPLDAEGVPLDWDAVELTVFGRTPKEKEATR